jgi:polyphenol oxidase
MTANILKAPILGEFPARPGSRCRYTMFNRHGGVSEGLYGSLNVGLQVGDWPEAVAANRRLVKDTLKVSALLTARQVHGSGVYCLREQVAGDFEVDGFDALITNVQDVGLLIQQADCQAVLLFDPVREVIAAVHCGWRGSVLGIVPRVVAAMAENFGTVPAELQAVISPSLGPCCAEFVNFKSELPESFRPFMVRDNYFDFWQITRAQLLSAGLALARIEAAGLCTCCSADYFSYRRASRESGGLTGRHCSVITLIRG